MKADDLMLLKNGYNLNLIFSNHQNTCERDVMNALTTEGSSAEFYQSFEHQQT